MAEPDEHAVKDEFRFVLKSVFLVEEDRPGSVLLKVGQESNRVEQRGVGADWMYFLSVSRAVVKEQSGAFSVKAKFLFLGGFAKISQAFLEVFACWIEELFGTNEGVPEFKVLVVSGVLVEHSH